MVLAYLHSHSPWYKNMSLNTSDEMILSFLKNTTFDILLIFQVNSSKLKKLINNFNGAYLWPKKLFRHKMKGYLIRRTSRSYLFLFETLTNKKIKLTKDLTLSQAGFLNFWKAFWPAAETNWYESLYIHYKVMQSWY